MSRQRRIVGRDGDVLYARYKDYQHHLRVIDSGLLILDAAQIPRILGELLTDVIRPTEDPYAYVKGPRIYLSEGIIGDPSVDQTIEWRKQYTGEEVRKGKTTFRCAILDRLSVRADIDTRDIAIAGEVIEVLHEDEWRSTHILEDAVQQAHGAPAKTLTWEEEFNPFATG